MDADHAQAVVGVALVPRHQVRQRAQRVHAAEVPELDEHGPAALLVHPQRGGVDPLELARERRGGDGARRCAHARSTLAATTFAGGGVSISADRLRATGVFCPVPTHFTTPHLLRRRLTLRKFLIAAIAALASIALASVAVAQIRPDVEVDHHGFSVQGRHEEEAQGRQGHDVRQEQRADSTTASKIEIDFPTDRQALRQGPHQVRPAPSSRSPAARPTAPQVEGRHRRLERRRGPAARPADVQRDRLRRRQQPASSSTSSSRAARVTKALQGKISSASGKFKQKLVITIPPDLQQPAPGLYAALTDLKSTLSLKKGKNSLISLGRLQEEEAHVRRRS